MSADVPREAHPRVLVLLASRNGADCIARQIDSVLRQERVDVRVQVRDDCSTDATRYVIARYQESGSRVSLLADHSRSGSASANFFALARQADVSNIDYVAFCDQDDEWFPDKLARATTRLSAKGAGGYSAAVRAQWPDGRATVQAQSAASRRADYLFEGAGQGCTFVFSASLFAKLQRSLQEHARLLPSIHYHDWALHALSRSAGAHWIFDPQPSMIYYQHQGNDTGARSSRAGIARRLGLIRSGWYSEQVRAVVALVRAVNPADSVAAEWDAIDVPGTRSLLSKRWAKARFIARNGRRKWVDRTIQLAAVALGYL